MVQRGGPTREGFRLGARFWRSCRWLVMLMETAAILCDGGCSAAWLQRPESRRRPCLVIGMSSHEVALMVCWVSVTLLGSGPR